MSHGPLYGGVWLLQAIMVTAGAVSRWQLQGALWFAAAWCTGFAITLALGYVLARRRFIAGQRTQLAQLCASATVLALWVAWLGWEHAWFVASLGLLLTRNASLTGRRDLYFDMAIALAVFYEAIAADPLPYRFAFAMAFLCALVFVLMADYTDRRLAYARVGDARELTAVMPGVANAIFSTVLVTAIASLVYLLLPQPSALELGLFPDRGPPLAGSGSDGASGEDQGPGSAKGDRGEARRESGGTDEGRGKKETRGLTGSGAARGAQANNDSAPASGGSAQGERKSEQDGDARRGGDDTGKGRSMTGAGYGPGGSAPERQGSTEWQRGGFAGLLRPHPQGPLSGPGSDRKGNQSPAAARFEDSIEMQPGRDDAADRSPEGKDEGSHRRPDRQATRDAKAKSSEGDRSSSESSPQEQTEPSKGQNPRQTELITLFMDADRPLYLRVRVYAVLTATGWHDGSDTIPWIVGRRMHTGEFLFHGGPGRDSVLQRIKLAQDGDERMPAAYLPTQIQTHERRLGHTGDRILLADHPLAGATRFDVRSVVRYLGDRPSGNVENRPSAEYLFVPVQISESVRSFASRIAGAHGGRQLETAAALEAHLRANYTRGDFQSVEGRGDWIEQLLFEARAVRSVDLASALAVLLRTVGIPSRVVAGYRARRLNPVHGMYEVWRTDGHYWVEAYVGDGWALFEPSPWVQLPAKTKPSTAFEAAEDYVRFADEASGDKVAGGGKASSPAAGPPDPLVPRWYLDWVLVYGWLVTFGWLASAGLFALAFAGWHWRWWTRPFADAYDRLRLRLAAGSDAADVLGCYYIVERMGTRRGLRREHSENHAEYLARLARSKPHLKGDCTVLAAAFSAARYGLDANKVSARAAQRSSRSIADLIDEAI